MTRTAMLEIRVATLPRPLRGKIAPLGVLPADHERVSEGERERVGRETSEASVLLGRASRVQTGLVERLARAAPEQRLRFASVTVLERFLAATRTLDAAAAGQLTDGELAKLWRAKPAR